MPENFVDVFSFKNEEVTLTIYNHLSDIGFDELTYYTSDDGVYHIACHESIKDDIEKQIIILAREKLDIYMSPTEKVNFNSIIDKAVEEAQPVAVSGESFVSASEKYENEKSSAFSLLFIGIAGLIFIVLNLVGVLNILGKGRMLFTITMTGMFIIFLIVGLLSLKRMKKLKKSIDIENSLSDEIKSFLLAEIKPEIIDDSLDDDLTDEEKYLYRLDIIMNITKERFASDDELLIEHLIEETYDTIFS